MGPKTGIARLLIVEDNEGDVRLIQEAFRHAPITVELDVVGDGVEALSFLRRTGQHQQARRPDLVLLDLTLPRKNGLEVLAEIKGDPALRTIPVIVLSGSTFAPDIQQAYEVHANCYIRKPTGLKRLLGMVRRIEEFWLELVELPSRS